MSLFIKNPWWPVRVPWRRALRELPHGVYEGANRYDTDNECVLHLWRDGQSWDVRWPKRISALQAMEEKKDA